MAYTCEVLMNLIHDTCSKILSLKLQEHFPGACEVTQIGYELMTEAKRNNAKQKHVFITYGIVYVDTPINYGAVAIQIPPLNRSKLKYRENSNVDKFHLIFWNRFNILHRHHYALFFPFKMKSKRQVQDERDFVSFELRCDTERYKSYIATTFGTS